MEKSSQSEYAYNNLASIENLRHEVITDKTLTYHDSLFKIIIIGDSGNLSINLLDIAFLLKTI
jgi:hypothetical protein